MKTQRRSWPPPVRRIIPLCSLVLLLCLSSCSDDNPSSPPAPKAPAKATSAVAVTDPARGGMLQGGTLDPSAITASGMACDTVSTLTSLSIDGQAVALTGTPPCFDFSTQLDSRWGLNIITGTARNQTGGKTDFVQSYLRSPEYFGVPARERSRAIILDTVVPDGVYTRVNQDLADDGSRYDIDDIATVAQLELSTLNLNAALPNPLVVTPDGNGDGQVDSHTCNCSLGIPDIVAYSTGYRVGRGTLSMGNPVVDYVGLGSDGLHVSISVSNVSMPVSVSGYLDEGCFTMCTVRIQPHATVTGTVHANYLNIEATVGASVGPNGTPVVDICGTCLDIVASGLTLDIDWGGLEFLDPVFGLSNLTTQIILAFRDDLEAAAKASIRPALV
ncbi:MAG TPA: hypothetical protein VFX92_05550, partial [Candidatus Krumholzibacteria bacterium]|nr:hypothetical protein [Candidatus Krumholzibacteria bacterium]